MLRPSEPLRARALMRPRALIYFYRRRLRVHTAQELLAGLGVAVAVALVFAVTLAGASITGSADEVVHAVVGPADLQLRDRDADGFDQRLVRRVERLPGVAQAAPLLEQTATIRGPHARQVTVDLAGTNVALALLDGLAHTLPVTALAPGGIGLSRLTAARLGVTGPRAGVAGRVLVKLRGVATSLKVSAVLGHETFGALAHASVAVMPLGQLQALAGLKGRITRVLVVARPGQESAVATELRALAGGRLTVAGADQDIALLGQALHPSNQANALFASIAALLGFLFAFNAMLLTVPERRQAIAELRLIGTKRTAIVQMVLFQALCLGVLASLVGLCGGYLLSLGVFRQSPGYLAHAFTLGTSTVVGVGSALLALAGGVLATCLASIVPLLDLRRGRTLDAVDLEEGVPGNALPGSTQWLLAFVAGGLVVFATLLLVLAPAAVAAVCIALALATPLAVPSVFSGVLRAASALTRRLGDLTILPLALAALRATTLRSLALAATGAVAIFGSVALGGARADLLRGISGYTSHYVGAADLWIVNPDDNQAISDFAPRDYATRIGRLPAVAAVHSFQGSFLDIGNRRAWIIGWPAGARLKLLEDQVIDGHSDVAVTRIRAGGWITVSRQLAAEHHVGVGGTLRLPTPRGEVGYRIAATTTNFGWSPGAIVMSTADYARAWGTAANTALGVDLRPGTNAVAARRAIEAELGPGNGLEVLSAQARARRIESTASEGLSKLGEIATLLVLAAVFAMAAALGSSIWQRRASLAGLRLAGAKPARLRRILAMEAALMLSAGCLTGAVAGIYGQVVIDRYLRQITGFPVARSAIALRPLATLALVIACVLAIVLIPGWLASRVSPTLALDE